MEHLAWVQNREHLILKVKQKWNDVTILVPRSDNLIHQTNCQIINALNKQRFSGNEMILYCDHSNMLKNGNPNADYLDLSEDNSTYSRKEFLCWQQLYTLKNQFILSWTFLTKTVEDPDLDSVRATEGDVAVPTPWSDI